ncbi:MAG TPA: DUF983 domain-containing protein [Actinophytocola sp.]|uniref:DUF983 domain-containing protein n=1 Tax=Actinophytocola sp. TaxID=1872138 RepID=UPI002DDCA224|nr:DUF983 domain-containing protein [Actinophytocola sp.]HEV2780593.1 DUF983 domain-containing protein [Actinophytocola sp.]
MVRVVRGRDERVWTLQAEMEWRSPTKADDFEHDVSSGHGPGFVMLAFVVVLTLVLVVWSASADISPPLWLILLILLVVLFFPIRWALRRPYTIIAATGDDGEGKPTEQWEGVVRGMFKVRQQMAQIARAIEDESMPGIEGPLKPVG